MSRMLGPSPARSSRSKVPTIVSPSSAWGYRSTRAPREASRSAVHAPTSSTPAFVYEPQSTFTSRSRSARYAGRAASSARRRRSSRSVAVGLTPRSLGRLARRAFRATGRPRILAAMRLIEIRLLDGPNLYRLEPTVKVEVVVGRRRTWYGVRAPGRHAVVRLGGRVPLQAAPPPVRDIAAWIRRLHDVTRVGDAPPAPHGDDPSQLRAGALDRRVPVAGARSGRGHRRRRGPVRDRRARPTSAENGSE